MTGTKVVGYRKGTKYGYARVSTAGQELETQMEALIAEGCEEIFHEKVTGTKVDRPELNHLLTILEAGDTIVVTKLDRLARNTEEGIKLVQELFERNVRVHVLNIGMLENTAIGKFFLTTLLAVAELERNMILERMAEGKALARQRANFRDGRPPKYTAKQLDHALSMLDDHSYTQVEEMTGISKSTLVRAKRKATHA